MENGILVESPYPMYPISNEDKEKFNKILTLPMTAKLIKQMQIEQ